MVYETKFTADLLASLLNIPPNKTLLRRHLNTHFKELLGREVIQAKREAETTLGYIPLTPSAKIKVSRSILLLLLSSLTWLHFFFFLFGSSILFWMQAVKKPQFTLKRKKNKQDVDYGDLVCPLDDGASGENPNFSTNACPLNANGGGFGVSRLTNNNNNN